MKYTTTNCSRVAFALQFSLVLACLIWVEAFLPSSVRLQKKSPVTMIDLVESATRLLAHGSFSYLLKKQNKHRKQNRALPRKCETSLQIFQSIDRTGRGTINMRELKQYLKTQGSYTDEVAQSIFQRLDVNRRGELGLEDLQRGIHDHQLFQMQQSSEKHETTDITTRQRRKKMMEQTKMTSPDNDAKDDFFAFLQQEANRFFYLIDAEYDGFMSRKDLAYHFFSSNEVSRLLQQQADVQLRNGEFQNEAKHSQTIPIAGEKQP